MPTLKKNSRAPQFSLKDFRGHTHPGKLGKSEFLVVYFYPKDDTPGCTIEAKEFSKALPKFKSRNVHVYGISGGTEESKEKFCGKYGLKVTLLNDPEFEVAKAFGAFGKKTFMGRTYTGVLRKTFILDQHHRVLKVFDKVKPAGHPDEVLEAIDEMLGSGEVHEKVKPNQTTRRDNPRTNREKGLKKLHAGRKTRARVRGSTGRRG